MRKHSMLQSLFVAIPISIIIVGGMIIVSELDVTRICSKFPHLTRRIRITKSAVKQYVPPTTSNYEEEDVVNDDSNEVAPLLLVVIAINMTHNRLAAASQRAYCRRHGYRMVVQKHWRGKAKRPRHQHAVRGQKLLACSLARGEQFVLVLDADIVIAPWTPPIHKQRIGNKIGIVDEDQPTARFNAAVQQMRSRKIKDESRYYSLPFGDRIAISHGLLNTGMVLLQPKFHCSWLHNLYYHPASQKWFNEYHNNYDQPVLGAALLRKRNFRRMHHAWNRGWIWYKEAKKSIHQLDQWMKFNNITFRPMPYAKNILP